MKMLKLFGLLALIIINSFSSCGLFGHEPKSVFYSLVWSFRDASGNDLVKGIGYESSIVDPDSYVLDFASKPCDYAIVDERVPGFGMGWYNGYYCLTTSYSMLEGDCEEKMLTYKLQCPYVFGDDVVHEIVTYWENTKFGSDGLFTRAICNCVELDGRVIPVSQEKGYRGNYSMVTIILEDREM